MSNDTPDPSQNGQTPDGTRKPDLPPGLADDGDDEDSSSDEDAAPGTKKPDLPPGLARDGEENGESDEPGTTKPAGPPGAKKPAGPPSPGSDEDADDGPSLPPGYGGDGAGEALSREDFQSDQEVRWCPGCGDYAILSTVQRLLPDLGVDKENVVFVSGIGCAGRFPYYMDTYGLHGIHGRAPAI
ncbi:MAG: 2-oxoacid:ferredoxin oxidoreductase subunit beta, partial [Bacteroidetes bacterium QH_2_63_10]